MNLAYLIETKETRNRTNPFIIAEAGVNHEGSIDIAKRLIFEAKEGGADAIKFQSYKAETLASKDSPAYWDLNSEPTTSQYELFKKHDSFWKNEFELLYNECEKIGIEFLSTPFDIESANFLNPLMSTYKISSSDISNKPFIEYLCDFNKPILLSVGASTKSEIENTVSWINKKNNPLAIMHCVLNYPTPNNQAQLATIPYLQKLFPELLVGYSDHTLPEEMDVLKIASLLGASIIEKHFTHDKTLPGNDHYHAMDKIDLKKFRDDMLNWSVLYGEENTILLDNQQKARTNARRSLVLTRSIKKGNKLKEEDLTWKRPASGISPSEIDSVIGKVVNCDLAEDTVLKVEYLN